MITLTVSLYYNNNNNNGTFHIKPEKTVRFLLKEAIDISLCSTFKHGVTAGFTNTSREIRR